MNQKNGLFAPLAYSSNRQAVAGAYFKTFLFSLLGNILKAIGKSSKFIAT